MDDRGRFYADKALANELDEVFGVKVRPIEKAPADAVEVPVEYARELALLPFRCRRAYVAAKKQGKTDAEALALARARRDG